MNTNELIHGLLLETIIYHDRHWERQLAGKYGPGPHAAGTKPDVCRTCDLVVYAKHKIDPTFWTKIEESFPDRKYTGTEKLYLSRHH